MIYIDWRDKLDKLTWEEYKIKLLEESLINPLGWEMLINVYEPFGISGYAAEEKCCKCGSIGDGAIRLGQKIMGRLFALPSLCYVCSVEICLNPNETVCHMLNRIDTQYANIINGKIWHLSIRNTIYTNIYGSFFSVGPFKKNQSLFWAISNGDFHHQKFTSLEDAKKNSLRKCLEAIPRERERILSLYDPNSLKTKSKDQQLFEDNDL